MKKPETPTINEPNESKVPEQQTDAAPTTSVVGSVGETPQINTPKEIPFLKNRKLLKATIVFAVIYLVLLAAHIVVNVLNKKNISGNNTPVSHSIIIPTTERIDINVTPKPTPTPVDLSGKFTTVDLGVVSWYEKPKFIFVSDIIDPELDSYRSSDYLVYTPGKTQYLEVASTSNGYFLITAFIPSSGMAINDNTILHFAKNADGNAVYFYTNLLQQRGVEDVDLLQMLLPNVKYTKQLISDLEIPDTITSEGKMFQKIGDEYKMLSELENPVKISESDYGTIYKVAETLWVDGLYRRKLYLYKKDGSLTRLAIKVDGLTDDHKQNIVWTDGLGMDNSFTQDFIGGCGSGYPFTPVLPEDSNFIKSAVEIGKDVNGNAALQVKDPNNSLVKTIYGEIYKVGRDPSYTNDFLTLEEFAEKRNHYLFQDSSGDWQLFVNQEYAPMAECAKPVIYLYPEKETEVFVKVGADIKESEPLYNTDGWRVTARPSGKLISNGAEYDYLFWDGTGLGEYPNYRNYGSLVEQENVEKALRLHLNKLGLNDKESDDFLEYWIPLIPKSPYVRLTWLKTEDMNVLAPLSVFPKPDTVIRVFLEFEGLSQPRKLIPQVLDSIPRKGFTLVEWGGLLIKVID